jgi:hypothetical protein
MAGVGMAFAGLGAVLALAVLLRAIGEWHVLLVIARGKARNVAPARATLATARIVCSAGVGVCTVVAWLGGWDALGALGWGLLAALHAGGAAERVLRVEAFEEGHPPPWTVCLLRATLAVHLGATAGERPTAAHALDALVVGGQVVAGQVLGRMLTGHAKAALVRLGAAAALLALHGLHPDAGGLHLASVVVWRGMRAWAATRKRTGRIGRRKKV